MAISLDAIYQPINKFFLQKFGQGEGAPVFFRFAQVPVKIYDSDFLVQLHPEWGPSPAMATELLSDLIDSVTRLNPNGHGVWLDPPRISELYHDEILGPSLPFSPAAAGADAKQALIDDFSQIKSDAISRWTNCKADSLKSNGSLFRPSNATPQNWWIRTCSDVWTPQEFQIQGAATATPGQPPNQLLRMKISDSTLQTILLSHVNPVAAPVTPPVVLATDRKTLSRPTVLSPPTRMMARPMLAAMLAGDASAPRPQVAMIRPATGAVTAPSTTSVAMHTELMARSSVMPVRQRIELQSVLSQTAPTQPVAVTDVTISFDYCLVTVARPWIQTSFLNNKLWFVSGQSKGSLSANDGHGMPALPVGFIALQNLRIKGPWTPADITNLEQSDQFGPFVIDSKVVDGAIGHADIQIVGWMLQDVPDLPPMDDDLSTTRPSASGMSATSTIT
jgi:hypothetical protein